MPTIDLPKEPPLPGANTFYFPIKAVMLYPRDEGRRDQWYAAAMAGSYHYWREHGAPPSILEDFHGWIGVLWEFKQAPHRVYRDGMARISRAALSGQVLMYLLRLHQHHPERCRLEQAKALVVEFAPREGASLSESLVTKVWAEFKTVSHLWATFLKALRDEAQPEDNAVWAAFLGAAEVVREAAEKARLLDPRETWKAPDGRGIPRPENPPEFLPLSDEMLEFLSQQFPA